VANASYSKENGSILVLKFDRNQPLALENYSGRTITLHARGLEPGAISFQKKGHIRGISVYADRIVIDCSRYVKVKMIPAGTGTYIFHFQITTEPSTASEPIQSSQSSRESSQQTYRQQEEPQETPEASNNNFLEDQVEPDNTYRDIDPELEIIIPSTIKLAIQLASDGESGRAIALLNSIQASDPDFPWSRFAIGKIYEENGEISRALDKYRQALIFPETESIAAVHIALVFQSMGNAESAISMWERVLELSGGQLNLPEGEPETAQYEVLDVGKEKLPFFERFRLYLIIIAVAIVLGAGVFLFFFFKNRKKNMGDLDEFGIPTDMYEDEDVQEKEESAGPKVAKMYAEQQDVEEDDDEDDIDSQIAELDRMVEDSIDLDDEDDFMNDSALSDTKVKKVQTLHEQGATVREIAETLGLGQDEVRMAINLSEA